MRLWENEEPGVDKEPHTSDYETVGYVLKGRARLESDDKTLLLEPGDSYVVPAGAIHTYEILETFSAIETTAPPARQ